MHACLSGDRRGTRVHHDELRWIRAFEPVEDAHPGHGLRLGHVVAEEHDSVGVIYVCVGAWLPVSPSRIVVPASYTSSSSLTVSPFFVSNFLLFNFFTKHPFFISFYIA